MEDIAKGVSVWLVNSLIEHWVVHIFWLAVLMSGALLSRFFHGKKLENIQKENEDVRCRLAALEKPNQNAIVAGEVDDDAAAARSATRPTPLISLADATERAWKIDATRKLPEFEVLSQENPQAVMRRLAERIFDGRDPKVPIFGTIGNPPWDDEIAEPHTYTFSEDLAEMVHMDDEDEPPEKQRRWRNLRVKWSDVDRRLRAIRP